jgi:hypothetical protein
MKNIVRLLIRPSWFSGESWAGYLLRLAEANQVPIGHLAGILSITPRALIAMQPREALHYFSISAAAAPHVKRSVEHDTTHTLSVGRCVDTAVCARCIAEDSVAYVRAQWEYPLEIGCRKHEVALLTECASCRRKLNALRRKLMYCNCGASLAEQQQQALHSFWTKLPGIFGIKRSDERGSTFRPFEWKERLAASVVQRIAAYDRGTLRDGFGKPRILAKLPVQDAEQAQRWFEDWPREFVAYYAKALRTPNLGEKRRRPFISSDSLSSKHFPAIRKAIGIVTRRRMRSIPSRKLSREDYLRRDTQTLGSASVVLGSGESMTMTLARAGLLPGAVLTGDHSLRISTRHLMRLIPWFHGTVPLDQAATAIGLKFASVERLAEAGVLGSTFLGIDRTLRVRTADCQALIDHLLGLVRYCDPTNFSVRTLDHALYRASRRGPSGTALLMHAICSGEIGLFCSDRHPASLDGFFLNLTQVKKLWRPLNRAS